MKKTVLGLAEIVIWSQDLEASLDFYRDLLGLELMEAPAEISPKFLTPGDGALGVPQMIVLVPHPEPDISFPREKPKRVLHHLAFTVDPDRYEDLRDRFSGAGLELREGIHPVLKGVRTFYVDDPDGNEVEIIGPEDEVVLFSPPSAR